MFQQRRPVVFWALVLVVQVRRGRFVVVLWPRLFVVEVIRVARCDAGASCGPAHAAIFMCTSSGAVAEVATCASRCGDCGRDEVRALCGGVLCCACVLFAALCISDTKMEIASKAPYPKPKSRWASHAETPLEQ